MRLRGYSKIWNKYKLDIIGMLYLICIICSIVCVGLGYPFISVISALIAVILAILVQRRIIK